MSVIAHLRYSDVEMPDLFRALPRCVNYYCTNQGLNPYLSLQQNPHARILKSATTGLLLSTTRAVLVVLQSPARVPYPQPLSRSFQGLSDSLG